MSPIMDRRRFLISLPALALAPKLLDARATRALSAVALNHVELVVADVGRSVEFYQELLGVPVQARENGRTVLRIGGGPQFLAIRGVSGSQAPSFGEMGIAVSDYDVAGLAAALEGMGVARMGSGESLPDAAFVLGADGNSIYVRDPNGLMVRVVDPTHCGGTGALGNVCASVGPTPQGRFATLDLNHFTCSVPVPERSVAFFQNVFGLPVQAYQAQTPALGIADGPQFLMFTGGGAAADASAPGTINHICLTMEDFDVERILTTLADFGISARADGEGANTPLRSSVSMRMPNRGGAPEGTPEVYFSDLDGLRVQLQDPTYCGGGGVLGSVCDPV